MRLEQLCERIKEACAGGSPIIEGDSNYHLQMLGFDGGVAPTKLIPYWCEVPGTRLDIHSLDFNPKVLHGWVGLHLLEALGPAVGQSNYRNHTSAEPSSYSLSVPPEYCLGIGKRYMGMGQWVVSVSLRKGFGDYDAAKYYAVNAKVYWIMGFNTVLLKHQAPQFRGDYRAFEAAPLTY